MMSVSLLKKLAGITVFLFGLWMVYLYQRVPHEKTPFAKNAEQAERVLIEKGVQKVERQ